MAAPRELGGLVANAPKGVGDAAELLVIALNRAALSVFVNSLDFFEFARSLQCGLVEKAAREKLDRLVHRYLRCVVNDFILPIG